MKTFIAVIIIFASHIVFSQDRPSSLSIQSIKTDLRESAVKMILQYLPIFDSLFSEKEIFASQDRSLFQLTTQFDVQSGSKDAFSYSVLKVSGFLMCFDTISVGGIVTPNTAKLFHVLPFSVGLEANKDFSVINGVAEAGYSPWYQQPSVNLWKPLKRTQIGFFLQGGYKFNPGVTTTVSAGGSQDQSKEAIDQVIFRAKGNLSLDTKNILKSKSGFGLIGGSTLWYDFLNKAFYYRLEGKLRLYLNKDIFYDLVYEKGSGAPNFNQGDQYGMGLTVAF
jgi:hypothetical protein